MSSPFRAEPDEQELRDAIDAGDITIALQPLVNVRSGEIVRLEALARWSHPTRGAIPPATFIPIAEHAGSITRLTSAVLMQTARYLTCWRTLLPQAQVDVNVSMVSLHDPMFPDLIAEFLGSLGLEPSWFGFEVTESTFMYWPERTAKAIAALRSLGCRVSIDDFGSGYSSLGHLATLPVNAVKIDRQFVTPMTADHRREAIVRATIALGHDLGFEVVAEGVEDAATMELLRALGCDLAQGFHIARPMAPDALPGWIRSWTPNAPAAPPDGRRPVLVVDDEPAIVEVIGDILTRGGFRVVTAGNGAEALRSIEAELPYVVLVDMQMPILDGAGFIDVVHERGLDLPIILMTAGPGAERWATALGASGFLRKPFDVSSVLDVTTRFAIAG
ncbi:MAG TPA: EAL domain-containing protein [Candidatus Saccharimonadales bacterium]|nr:EAL domain-containing protein [Candidatus Saccharimonadales bacterium]